VRVAGRGYRDGVRNLEVMVKSLSGGSRPEIQEDGRVMAAYSLLPYVTYAYDYFRNKASAALLVCENAVIQKYR